MRHIMVTGASSGIGLEVCKLLLHKGYNVIGMATKSKPSIETMLKNSRFHFEAVDFEHIEPLPERFNQIGKYYSNIDAIVFCAGKGQFGNIEEFSYGQIASLLNINFLAHAFLIRTYIPKFKTKGFGDFIFVGSEAAITAGRKGAIYSATKFATRGMAQALRSECSGKGIRVGIVNPGMVQTEFYNTLDFSPGEHPDNYILPEDVAAVIEFMLNSRRSTVIDEVNLTPLKKVIKFKK